MSGEQKWFLQPISVPLGKGRMDPTSVQAAGSAVVSPRPRSFEVFWNGSEFDLCFGSSTMGDLDLAVQLYSQHVRIGSLGRVPEYPAIATLGDGTRYPVPSWLPKLDPSHTRFLYVGNEFGHCYAVFEGWKSGTLLTPTLIALQRSRFAWVQFEWFEAPVQAHLSDLRFAIDSRYDVIDRPIEEVRTSYDSEGKPHTRTYYRDHPAKGGEFHATYAKLKAHIERKMGSRLAVMIVRGLVDSRQGEVVELPFAMIEDSGEIRHPSASTWDSKIGERLEGWRSYDPRILVDLVQRRVFDVDRPMRNYVKSYLSWRRSLPFVLLGSEEVGLFVHPPSGQLRGVKTRRRSELPPPPTNRMAEKEGIQITGA